MLCKEHPTSLLSYLNVTGQHHVAAPSLHREPSPHFATKPVWWFQAHRSLILTVASWGCCERKMRMREPWIFSDLFGWKDLSVPCDTVSPKSCQSSTSLSSISMLSFPDCLHSAISLMLQGSHSLGLGLFSPNNQGCAISPQWASMFHS